MNLRSMLREIGGTSGKKPEPQAEKSYECWQKAAIRPLTEFPGAFGLKRETVMLLQAQEMPENFGPERILYLDTETTGLSGGAGTVAFEVGLGYLTDAGFVIRQFIMRDYPEEKDLLKKLSEIAEGFDVLCTFNGATFDLPLLRSRCIMNRQDWKWLEKPHIDLLHIARRVWKLRLKKCNLAHLEEAVLGMPREEDLPGSLVPQRFFDYLKTNDFSLLTDVLRHNEQDIASLCVLINRMAWLYEHPESIAHGEDLFSVGKALEKQHHPEEARRCYRLCKSGSMRVQGQLRLAHSYRQGGEQLQAAAVWEEMLARKEGGIQPCVELAKYHEHVTGNIELALRYTQEALILLAEPTLCRSAQSADTLQKSRNALQYRYARLKRRQLKGVEKDGFIRESEGSEGAEAAQERPVQGGPSGI